MLAILRLMRMDKPIGTLLLLWPTTWGLLVASQGYWDSNTWIIFLGGIVLMRAAGCVVNDLADFQFDRDVKRTCHRPLATGELKVSHGWMLFAVLIFMAFMLACQLKPLAFILAWVALGFTLLYPFTKRFFVCPQAVLGLAFSMGILMAFAQIQGELSGEAWVLFSLSAIWAIIYDTEYAMVDRDDDLKLGLKSSAIFFGQADRVILVVLSLCKIVLWSVFGVWQHYAWPFWLGLCGALAMFMLQWHLVWPRERDPCFRAFINNQWVGLSLACGLAGAMLMV